MKFMTIAHARFVQFVTWQILRFWEGFIRESKMQLLKGFRNDVICWMVLVALDWSITHESHFKVTASKTTRNNIEWNIIECEIT